MAVIRGEKSCNPLGSFKLRALQESEEEWELCSSRMIHGTGVQKVSKVVTGWQESLLNLVATSARHYEETLQTDLRFDLLEKVVVALRTRVSRIESKACVLVPIQMFESTEFFVQQPFLAVVQPDEDGFSATFFDANIGTSGDTQEEAVANLKDLILGTFEQFEALERENQLGPEPARQLSVLKKVIKRAT